MDTTTKPTAMPLALPYAVKIQRGRVRPGLPLCQIALFRKHADGCVGSEDPAAFSAEADDLVTCVQRALDWAAAQPQH